uniref:SRCR domain-containing protein n=1 Tax=Monodelphis domestica TaxID=13616 RepID=A0A5F8H7B7_MONDO
MLISFLSFSALGGADLELRLVNGNKCEGRVEVLYQGEWGTVCSIGWDEKDAAVVCKQLGCGSLVKAHQNAHFGAGSGPIWLSDVACSGQESTFWDCGHRGWGYHSCSQRWDAGVTCLGFVQLVGGDGPCSGRVEVNSGGEWATVCNWKFTHSTANVICAELGCGVAVSVLNGTHFGRGNGQIWAKEFQCKEDESHLQFCPTVPIPQGVCSHNMDVGVICSHFQLVNGSSRCEGRVEIQVSGVWGTLCDSHWDLSDANVLCRHLNCGLAMKPPEEVYFGEGSVQILADTFYCSGTESHLWDCPVTVLGASSCSRRKVASVICSGNQIQVSPFNDSQSDQAKVPVLFSENGQLRLVNGGRDPCSGRVEIYYNDTWGTICDDSWDMSDAHVVCRQLGCGVALKVMDSSHFGKGSGSIWLDELSCFGNESYLGECPSLHWGQHDCSHKEDAGVICSESLDLRLVSDDYDCAGWLEVFHNGTWGSVCSNLMDINTVSVICRHLSCGNKGYLDLHSNHRNLPIKWVDKINCQGQEPSLWHCPSQPWNQASCFEDQEAYITCGADLELRLVNGNKCEGRVEVLYQGKWGTVCSIGWDEKDAAVVCKQLGCGSLVKAHQNAHFGAGSGPIWLSDVACSGQESTFWDCGHRGWGQHSCPHRWDVGVTCLRFVQLVGGDGPCSGRVEVNSGGEWATVCNWKFTHSTANVICAELGCGVAVSVLNGTHFGRGNGQIWAKEFQCKEDESHLQFCPTVPIPQGVCSHNMDVGVICSHFQLVNGSSRCEGRVEIQVSGVWGTLCDSHWDLSDANVLCRHLNCGLAMKPPEEVYFGEGSVQILADTFYCSGTESHLWDCPVTVLGASSCSRRKVASVICSENIQALLSTCFPNLLRLVNGGRDPCSGRVEIYYNDTWGTICDDSWDMSDAHVVCRQLGCGVALKVMDSSHFGKGSGSIWLDELSCFGNESYLGECPSLHWGQHDCSHKEDAGVICSESLDLRLVSDDYDCAGWLEVFHNGTWGSVCSNLMDINTVSVICRHLSCGNKGYLDFHSNHRNLPIKWVDKINCQGQEPSLWHCPSQPWNQASCFEDQEAYITCEGRKDSDCPTSRQCTDKDKLQLRGGETPCSGRVEIWHDGSWGTVCDDSWDLAEANVVCQQLGCGSALASLEGAAFGSGNGTIWLDEVQCRGKETSLWDCPAEPWGQNDCKHDEDAGVVCSGDISDLCPFISAVSGYGESLYESMYEEINYDLTENEEDLLSNPGKCILCSPSLALPAYEH